MECPEGFYGGGNTRFVEGGVVCCGGADFEGEFFEVEGMVVEVV